MGYHTISSTDNQTDLGVIVSKDLKWKDQTAREVGKAYQMLGFIKRCSIYLTCDSKRSLYMALVRSHLDYASEVWSGQSVQHMVMIEGVQRRATKFIRGISGGEISYEERHRKLNLSYYFEL